MENILLIIQALAATSSRKEKQSILEANSKNMFLAKYLQVTYNPRLNFYIQAIQGTIEPPSPMTSIVPFDEAFIDSFIGKIAYRQITGGAAREFIETTYSMMSADDRQLFAWMVNRDIKAGCSVSTFNKIWPGLITTVPYMRCTLPKHNNPKDWFEAEPGLVVYSQEKMDAMFANVDVGVLVDGNKEVQISSRNGSPFPLDAFEGIVVQAKQLFHNVQLHGELLTFDKETQTYLPREKSNGYMNSMLQGSDANPNYEPRFVTWDMVPLDIVVPKMKFARPYSKRFSELKGIIDTQPISSVDSAISLVPTKMLKTMQEVEDHYVEMILQGKEGTVVKHPDTPWEDGTSNTQVKMKQESDADLKIVGFNEGSGRLESTFGSLICESADGLLSVGVSGLTDKMRQEIWARKDEVIGKIVVIRGNKVLSPEKPDGKHSIFLPRFVEIRSDKNEANTLVEVQDIFSKA